MSSVRSERDIDSALRRKGFRCIAACAVLLIFTLCAVWFLTSANKGNLVAWSELPVLNGGRVMPISTLARQAEVKPEDLLLACLAAPSTRQDILPHLPARSLQQFSHATQTLATFTGENRETPNLFTEARTQIEPLLQALISSKDDTLHQSFHKLLTIIDSVVSNAEELQRQLYTTGTTDESDQFSQIVVVSRHAARRREVLLASIELGAAARQMRREVEAAWLSLDATDNTLRVLPITTAADILSTRVESLTPPWISLTSLLHGSPLFIERFLGIRSNDTDSLATKTLAKLRQAWRASALMQFTAEVRLLAELLEPRRIALPNADSSLLKKTAYPTPYLMTLECRYNALSPFFWMVVLAAGSMVAVLVAWVLHAWQRAEEIAVVCSIVLLAASAGITACGGTMRALISGWAPATNMYETIILMAWMTMLTGLFATLAPLLLPPLRRAWQLAATSVFAVPRVILSGLVFWLVLITCFASTDPATGTVTSGWDGLCALVYTLDPIDFASVVLSLAMVIVFVPKAILTVCLTPMTLGATTASTSSRELRHKIADRKLMLLVTAAIAVIAGTVAMINAEFNPAIRPLAAVLRSNFWLTVHVVVIMASYSAALIVWGLSWVAVLAALVGRYDRSLARNISPLLIPMMTLTLLLLALGIVLGGRWADYSWGRFWGWDPKEVWALITMLYYAVVIHGARRRLYGSLGVAIGGQLGGIAVVTTWYGINYVFRAGMHAYAGGSATGATLFLYTFIAVHLVVATLVTFRYVVERRVIKA